MINTRPDSKSMFQSHLEQAQNHEKKGQLALSLRELREALRIRPRELSVKENINRLEGVISPPVVGPEPISSERFSSTYNLAIRYWDRNLPAAALKEVCLYTLRIFPQLLVFQSARLLVSSRAANNLRSSQY